MLEIRKVYTAKHCRKGIHLLWVDFKKSIVDVIVSVPTNTMVDENGKEISERITNY